MPDFPAAPVEPLVKRHQYLLLFATAMCVLLIAVLGAFGIECIGTALVLAFASFASGILTGFIFGIPKLGTIAAQDAKGNGSGRKANTNLEELSDWLTKIIVGLGLASITKAPDALTSLGVSASRAFALSYGKNGPTIPPSELVLAMLVAFAIFGFIASYVGTQIFLAPELKDAADRIALSQEYAKAAVSQAIAVARDTAEPEEHEDQEGAEKELERLANSYMEITDRDYRTRVSKKAAAAAKMGKLINTFGLDRDRLAKSGNEGVIVGLASAIVDSPEPKDMDRLLVCGRRVTRLHVQYGIVVAYIVLRDKGYVSPADKQQFLSILDTYEPKADSSLKTMIAAART